MTSKIVSSTKTTSAVFLATVLISGTIALSFPSFMIGSAQAQPYYGGGNDNRYNSYGSDYGMDNNNKRSYGNDYGYESQYQPSYKPDYYKPQYQSYGKDDKRDKSKDSSQSININKLNCINTNLNINGNNTGNINLGNKGGVAEERGYSGAYSSGSGGYSAGYDGYNNKQGKGFECIINNNNNNTNIGGGGNQTIPPGPTKTTLTVTKTVVCVDENVNALAPSIQQAGAIEDCDELEATIIPSDFTIDVTDTDPVPSSFQGSAAGTQVQIGAGPYEVEETPGTDVTQLLAENPNIRFVTTFTGGCTPANGGFEGTGTIEAGIAETCNIINTFTILLV